MLGCRSGGFTLVEVLIAILIFSLSLMALVPLLSTAASIDRENYLNVTARAMAADTLDSLMGNVTPLMRDAAGNVVPMPNPSTVTDQGIAITTSWTVTPVPAPGNRDDIAVTVIYEYKGQRKTFVLTAQRAR